MLELSTKSQFKKDLRLMQRRGKNLQKIWKVIAALQAEDMLPEKHHNHRLVGNYTGCWECHIEPDWLLIYLQTHAELVLVRTGTHADLFK